MIESKGKSFRKLCSVRSRYYGVSMKRSLTALIAATLVATTLTTTTASATPAHPKPVVKCEFTPTPENPAAKPVRIPSATARAKGTVDVYFVTNYGPFVVRMDRANAPCGVHNFVHLVQSRFYDSTQCFRLTNSARLGVLQCGDIYRQEEGGPGYKFPDE
jgi:peptidyl-prolyl cis-trans isomerase B (cyclophilin B)